MIFTSSLAIMLDTINPTEFIGNLKPRRASLIFQSLNTRSTEANQLKMEHGVFIFYALKPQNQLPYTCSL